MSYAIAPFLLGLLVGLLLSMRVTIIRNPRLDRDELADLLAWYRQHPADTNTIGTCVNCGFPAEEDGIALACGCVYCVVCADRGRHDDHPTDCAGPETTP